MARKRVNTKFVIALGAVILGEELRPGVLGSGARLGRSVEALAGEASWKPKTIHTLVARLVQKGALLAEKAGRQTSRGLHEHMAKGRAPFGIFAEHAIHLKFRQRTFRRLAVARRLRVQFGRGFLAIAT